MPKTILESNIERYTEAGYTLFPLNGKIPPKGCKWTRTEFNPLASAQDFPSGNFGVKLSASDVVIDIDPRNFNPGDDPLRRLEAFIAAPLLSTTFSVRTGNGGVHLYFQKDPLVDLKGALKDYPGIDIKTYGGYVVGAGSIHPDTKKEYTILHDLPVAAAPRTLIDLLIKKSERIPQPGTSVFTEDNQTKERFIRYLTTAPIAVEGENGDKTTFSVAAVAHDLALSPDMAYKLMLEHYNGRCTPPWPEDELRRKVDNAYQYTAAPLGTASVIDKFEAVYTTDIRKDQNDRILKLVYNIVSIFNVDMPGMLALNIWNEDVVFKKPAPWHTLGENVKNWTDAETKRCKYWLSQTRRFEPSIQMLEEALVPISYQQPFHPIKDYIESITWDGHHRIKEWLVKFLGVADNPYSRAVGLKILVAAVTRVYQPGHKFDYIPVLEGQQGIGKTRVLKVLGGDWYGDMTINVHNKDTVDAMRNLWIIEVSEMETTFRTETQALKSFLSRSTDICRLAYGRRSKEFPRHNVFVGTFNPEKDTDTGWLNDTTGNRRFWPIYCHKIDVDGVKKVRDQLWAEAYLYYKQHTELYFEDTTIEEQAYKEQTARLGVDPWYDSISFFINNAVNKNKEIFSSHQIFCDCLGGRPKEFTRPMQNRVAMLMRAFGFIKGVYYFQELGKEARGWKRPMVVPELGL